MASTPPPPTRVRTPPTPLHGPKYDAYEPYSPRRSNRISSKRAQHFSNAYIEPGVSHHSLSTNNGSAINTPKKSSMKRAIKRTTSQTFSPPSSPAGPEQLARSPKDARSTEANHRKSQLRTTTETDSDLDVHGRIQPFDSRKLGQYGFPTPAKTPRKRSAYDEVQLSSTARVLFPTRSGHAEDIMPSPRKARKHKHMSFGLDSFESERDGDAIQIYTDSRERIPEADESEDNPFVSPRNRRKGRESETKKSHSRSGTKHGMSKEIDEYVESGKGMVYVFRGKKFYRPFTDDELASGPDDELGTASDVELHRQAGHAAVKPLSRRNNPRRKLFQKETPAVQVEDVDEEAITDIESEHDTAISTSFEARTPTKLSFEPATPPKSDRKNRFSRAGDDELQTHTSPMWLDGTTEEVLPSSKQSRISPFDTWQRTKSTMKRARETEGVQIKEDVTGTQGTGKRAKGDVLPS